MLKNASGCYCYRYTPEDKWMLTDTWYDAGTNKGVASIVAKEGPLPVGAHTWRVYDGSKWADGTLTVGLLVRTSPALRASSYGAWPSNTNEWGCSDGG